MISRAGLINYLESVVYSGRRGIFASLVFALLVLFSGLYRFVIRVYILMFDLGLRKRRRLGRPVISVGNLTVGGTGKTPIVRYLCEGLVERGFRPAVLSYGYGGSLGGATGVVSDGKKMLLTPDEAGDEPFMLAEWMPGVPVVVGRHRTESGRIAVEELGADVLVLDDGFQVWKLERDIDVVLVSSDRPFDNGRTLPAGKLREPVGALRRADCVVVTGHQDFKLNGEAVAGVRGSGSAAPVFSGRFVPSSVGFLSNGAGGPLDKIRGKKAFALSSIANPASFEANLGEMGVELVGSKAFPDHHLYTSEDVHRAAVMAKSNGAEMLAVTEKDASKLVGFHCPLPIAVVKSRLELGDEAGFWKLVTERVS